METVDVAILGAGLAGLAAALRLRDAGITSLCLLERSTEVGGTWRDNTYPGCACDIPSELYSFSFEPNRAWTRAYPRQAEIQSYILDVVERRGLRPLIRLGAEVTELRWDGTGRRWTIHFARGEPLQARHVVSATGPLNKPAIPALPGREDFAGVQFHSSHWRHDVALQGRRVAVVGTGASAVQIVPELSRIAGGLTVFQRTPAWVLPRPDHPFSPLRKRLFAALPALQRLNRWRIYWRNEFFGLGFLGSRRLQGLARWAASAHLRRQVPDPALRATLTPDFAPGCKRLLVSNDFYRGLQQPQVQLVTSPVREVRPQGLVTADGKTHACDVIVWATGFKATEFVAPLKIHGESGLELGALWRDQPAATHLGLTVSGFPNYWMLVGPGTGLGHNSIVFMIESQLNAITDALRRHRTQVVRLRPEVQAASYARVQERMQRTVWVSGCRSWYQRSDGTVDTLWPGFTWQYWWLTRRFDAAAHNIGET